MLLLKRLLFVLVYIFSCIIIYFIDSELKLEWILSLSIIPIGILSIFYTDARLVLLPIVSSHLIYLSFPDIHWEFLIFFAFIPLFILIQTENSYRYLFFYGVVAGILTQAGGFYWLDHTIVVFGNLPQYVAIPIFMLYSFAFSLKFPAILMVLRWVKKHIKLSRVITFPIVIAIADFLIYELFPWYFGNSQFHNYYFSQIAEITGVPGITYLIALINIVLYEVIIALKDRKQFPVKPVVTCVIVISAVYLFGYIRIGQVLEEEKKSNPINVSVIQPNTPMGQYRETKEIYKTIEDLSFKAIRDTSTKIGKLDLIVWPESGAPFSYRGQSSSSFKDLINKLAKDHKLYLFFGNYDFEMVNSKQKNYNSAGLITPDLKQFKQYHKIFLLPFGEYMPLGDFFPSLYKITPHLSSGFTIGTRILNYDIGKAILAPQICYEIIVPSFTRKFIQKGANVIVNITNDIWFGQTKASKQHLVLASFRAIENRVPIIRSTNSGISTYINPIGQLSSEETKLNVATYLNHKVYPIKLKGIYTTIGDLFSYLLIFILIFLVLFNKNIRSLSKFD